MKSTPTSYITTNHFPKWLRRPIPLLGKKNEIENYIKGFSLHTVCVEAKCPNRNECFGRGAATFLVMGDICTRNCFFCNVKNGNPLPLNTNEPENIAIVVKKMKLSYVVITSVSRDDLPDGGASHIAHTVKQLKDVMPHIKVEVLVPDFKGDIQSLHCVLNCNPDVFNHNIETVPSLFSQIRPEANYMLSLQVLKNAAEWNDRIPVKSGFMVGLGESDEEIIALMEDLKKAKVTIITIGQYLQPSQNQVPVKEFHSLKKFNQYHLFGKKLGFEKIVSGPFVRSSYNAERIMT